MRSILVTGGAGYVGSGLLRELLLNGYLVTCVDKLLFGNDSLKDLLSNKNFTFINLDINEPNSYDYIFSQNTFDAVIHLAAIVGDPACKLYSNIAVQTNWDSSRRLFDKSKNSGVSKFIFASTCSNYGKMCNPNSYVDENSNLAPISLYADLKVKFENYLLNSKPIQDFSPTSLRFATVYGLSPRMRFDLTVNEFTKEVSLNRKLKVFGEQFWRPYCHVNDFANAFIAILSAPSKKVAYNVYNVGDTNENYTKKMIVEEIKKVFPKSRIEYVNKNEDPRDYRVNFDKIKNELGFKISKRVCDGILEIKEAIENKIIKNPDDQKYYNTPYEKKLS